MRPSAKPKRVAPDEQLLVAARDIARLEQRKRAAARALQAIDDELRIARRTLRALAQEIAGVNDELDQLIPAEPPTRTEGQD